MPTKSKSEGRMRSRSRSRGRSRSRSRGRSPSRSKATKTKQSPSPSRKPKPAAKTPTTPTRSSTRIKEISVKQEIQKMEEEAEKQGDQKSDSKREIKPSKVTPKSKYVVAGPITTFILTLGVPAFVLGINLLCHKNSCSINFKKLPSFPTKLSAYFDRDVVLLFLAYFVFQLALACIPLGHVVKIPAVKGGKSTTYRCNGFLSMFLSVLTLAGLIFFRFPVTMVHDKFIQLTTTAIVFSFLLGTISLFRSRNLKNWEKNEAAQTGCTAYDFFLGRALQPRCGPLNLKHFFVTRGKQMTWGLLNVVFVWKAYSEGTLTPSLFLVALCQGLYIVDFLLFEDSMAQTLYFREVGFGFSFIMASVLTPFLLSIQTRFLLEHSIQWHTACLAGFLVIHFIGYIIYRGSNSEKNRFRQDPHNPMFANFKKIPSSSGKKLLASGWWGLCRHPNYLGNLIMNISWALPLGLQHGYLASLVPLCTLLLLLLHARADNLSCQKKHGAAWDRYCREVKYTIIPYVY